jgi:hypothetical protein
MQQIFLYKIFVLNLHMLYDPDSHKHHLLVQIHKKKLRKYIVVNTKMEGESSLGQLPVQHLVDPSGLLYFLALL